MARGLFGIPYIVWSVVAFAIAVLYVFVVPRKQVVEASEGMKYVVLRWFQTIVWILLGLSFLLSGFGMSPIAGIFSTAAFIAYIAYGVLLIMNSR